MDTEVFRNINQILIRDSKSTTYKFALLRGTIDLIEDNSPYTRIEDGRVHFPLGLLVEKWIIYYFPLINVPQIHGSSNNIAFARPLKALVDYYLPRGGLSACYNDLKSKGIPGDIKEVFKDLVKCVADTITKMPMQYIGKSINKATYSIFIPSRGRLPTNKTIDIEYLINSLGTFSIPTSYYEAFQVLGNFVNGQDAILFKWAEFSVQASKMNLSVTDVLDDILTTPVTSRDIVESKELYRRILKEDGAVWCVWSGAKLNNYDIDHIIPFSIWKNNDLWNLLPAKSSLNNQKSGKIPTPELIDKRKNLIEHYWNVIDKHNGIRFQKELRVALLGHETPDLWQNRALEQLKVNCEYLISSRGFERWEY